jgi:TolB-like protein/DNA-binding winged helix-turn-helix (wHTH) protein/Tfp pilus assembly protein PilF
VTKHRFYPDRNNVWERYEPSRNSDEKFRSSGESLLDGQVVIRSFYASMDMSERTADRLVLSGVTIDFRGEEVRDAAGARAELRPRSFAVLRCLAANAGTLLTKDQLLSTCWPGVAVTEDSLVQCISEIRQALGEGARDVIRTVPRRGYLMALPEPPRPSNGVDLPPTIAPHSKPSIAVLPFEEFSGGSDRSTLGSGFADDLITELARERDLKVLARHTSSAAAAQGLLPSEIADRFRVRYVLDGSIRRHCDRMVVNARLIDGHDSRHVWAERFFFSAADVYTAQDEIVARIATTLLSEIRSSETVRERRRAPVDLDAYELTLRAAAYGHTLERESMIIARKSLRRAVALDPHYGPALICLGYLEALDAALTISGDLAYSALFAAIDNIRKGLKFDRCSALGYRALAAALVSTPMKDEALNAAEHAVALAPGDADCIKTLGTALMEVGQPAAALAQIERAIDLNPLAPAPYFVSASMCLFALGRLEESAGRAAQAISRKRDYCLSYLAAAASLAAINQLQTARARIAELLALRPDLTMRSSLIQAAYLRDPPTRARALACLRAAGLPEGTIP